LFDRVEHGLADGMNALPRDTGVPSSDGLAEAANQDVFRNAACSGVQLPLACCFHNGSTLQLTGSLGDGAALHRLDLRAAAGRRTFSAIGAEMAAIVGGIDDGS